MTNRRGISLQKTTVVGCALLLFSACSSSSDGGGSSGGAQAGKTSASASSSASSGGSSAASSSSSGGQVAGSSSSSSSSSQSGGQSAVDSSSSQAGKSTGGTAGTGGKTGGRTAGNTSSGETGGSASGGQVTGGTGTASTGTGTGGKTGGSSGTASGGKTTSTVDGGVLVNTCADGKEWPTANPAAAGPFEVAADKGVGPLAGTIPDPIYKDQQQRFNVYRPKNLATSGYCHPILIWANGYTDNPEPNPPLCVTDSAANKWCGQYLPMMNHLASHGFVVVASLSTATGSGDPLPTIVGMDWIIKQAEDSTSQYYHRIDVTKIGQLGHSFGGMSTCMSASDPRYKALATICGTRELSGVHTPMMFFCGGKDNTVKCDGVHSVFASVKDQPAVFINELNSDHGSWVYQGAKGVSLSSAAAWFRVHLMNDTANKKYFYGSGCTFCTDSRVKFEQNSLMTQ